MNYRCSAEACYAELMVTDPSRGWDAIADKFLKARSSIGVAVVRRWAKQLPPGAAVLDVGCGSGMPISAVLIEGGLQVFGVDASPILVEEFRRRFPSAAVVCEAAETSTLFHRKFDGAVAIGLLFLLPAEDQRQVIARIAHALEPGARFLFSAPRQSCEWEDILTGHQSLSLGEEEYRRVLEESGLRLAENYVDEGDNYYYDAERVRQ